MSPFEGIYRLCPLSSSLFSIIAKEYAIKASARRPCSARLYCLGSRWGSIKNAGATTKPQKKYNKKQAPPKKQVSLPASLFTERSKTTLAMYARFVFHLPAAARLPLDALSARPLASHSRKAKQAGRNILLTVWTPPPLVTKLAEEKSSARPQTPPPLERSAFLSSLFPFVPFPWWGNGNENHPDANLASSPGSRRIFVKHFSCKKKK